MANPTATILCEEFGLKPRQATSVVKLFEEGATVPFIAHYRKEATGNQPISRLKAIHRRLISLDDLASRKQAIKEMARAQDKLTPALADKIDACEDMLSLDDTALPFRAKGRTRADAARRRGVEPLAKAIISGAVPDLKLFAQRFVDGSEVPDADKALDYAKDIVADIMNENEKVRALVRSKFARNAVLSVKELREREESDFASPEEYESYRALRRRMEPLFGFTASLRTLTSARLLQLLQGEKAGILKINVGIDDEEMIERIVRFYRRADMPDENARLIEQSIREGYKRYLKPAIEDEVIDATLTRAEDSVIADIEDEYRSQLMEPPLLRRRILAFYPLGDGNSSIVAIDTDGSVMAGEVAATTVRQRDTYGAGELITGMAQHFRIDNIVIARAPGYRDAMEFIGSLNFQLPVEIEEIGAEGADVYASLPEAAEELPGIDPRMLPAVHIGRRRLDPLRQLSTIPSVSAVSHQYRDVIHRGVLQSRLDEVLSDCLHTIGVNPNVATRQMLSRISGLNSTLAANILATRQVQGAFECREDLLNVSRLGQKSYTLCAGFMRIPESTNPLDNTSVHPDQYEIVEAIAEDRGVSVSQLIEQRSSLTNIDPERYSTKTVSADTISDILEALSSAGSDPRIKAAEAARRPQSIAGTRTIADLHIGMELMGKVNNLTAFGAFVDLGIPDNGLLHLSQINDQYVHNPAECLHPGQPVRVRIIDIDVPRHRIALSMKGVSQEL